MLAAQCTHSFRSRCRAKSFKPTKLSEILVSGFFEIDGHVNVAERLIPRKLSRSVDYRILELALGRKVNHSLVPHITNRY